MGIDEFVVGHPERVFHAGHSLEVVYVAGGSHEFYIDFLGKLPHLFGDGFLVVVTVPAQVVGDDEIERVAVQPCQASRLPTGRTASAAGNEKQGKTDCKKTVPKNLHILHFYNVKNLFSLPG